MEKKTEITKNNFISITIAIVRSVFKQCSALQTDAKGYELFRYEYYQNH